MSILEKINNCEDWPSVAYPQNLLAINELADKSFSLSKFEGRFSSLLMYHQIIEAMCMHLVDDCHFFIQLSVYPLTIEFKLQEKKMLGYYIDELNNSINFDKKDIFIQKVTNFNSLRNKMVHRITRENFAILSKELRSTKNQFDEIFALYDEIQDHFRVTFHEFQKDVFIDYIEDSDSEDDNKN